MAAVPVTLQCVVYPRDKSVDPYPATLVGYAFVSGLHPDQSPPADQPHPEHPIVLPPVEEPPPETPLDQMLTMVAKAPPADGGWGFFPEYGWLWKPRAGASGPKRR